MTVGEIISLGALFAGKDDISADFAAGDVDKNDNDIKKFFTAYNVTISELCEEVEPIVAVETVSAPGGKIYYADLQKKAVRIFKLKADGKAVPFLIEPEYVAVKVAASEFEITYAYAPEYVSDTAAACPYDQKTFSVRTLAKAVAAEYLITVGLFEEAAVLRKDFEDAVAKYALKKKREKIKKRVWS